MKFSSHPFCVSGGIPVRQELPPRGIAAVEEREEKNRGRGRLEGCGKGQATIRWRTIGKSSDGHSNPFLAHFRTILRRGKVEGDEVHTTFENFENLVKIYGISMSSKDLEV